MKNQIGLSDGEKMHYLTTRLAFLIIMFSFSAVIILSEMYFFKGRAISNSMNYASVQMEFENMFWTFSLGDRMYSGLEQIVMVFLSILGLCALDDILVYQEKRKGVNQ